MNIKKYLKKMAQYLSVDKRECASRKSCIKKVLKALNERERNLLKKLSNEKDSEQRVELTEEIKIVHRKRKKGLKALRELKKS